MEQIKPMKGFSSDKVNFDSTFFSENDWVSSIKYDGNLIFIRCKEGDVRFFTSNWKEFYLPKIAEKLSKPIFRDYCFVAEFMYDCEGKLGDRTKSAVLTSLRTAFNKGLSNPSDFNEDLVNIKIFDHVTHSPFDGTLGLFNILSKLNTKNISFVEFSPVEDVESLFEQLESVCADGWEGLMLRNTASWYKPGKRVRDLIKLKKRKTADLLCVGVVEGIGKCDGIGSLTLKDSKGRLVNVGSGLDYSESVRKGDFIGKVIEISYEQILDTYIQPVFIRVRDDKTENEID